MAFGNRYIEHRQFPRIPARFVVMMKLDIKNLAEYAIDAEIINISEGGMLLELQDIKLPETGSENKKISLFYSNLRLQEQLLWLQFRLPTNTGVVQAIAKPVWIEKPTKPESGFCLLGVQYTQLMPEAQRAISYFIATQLKQFS